MSLPCLGGVYDPRADGDWSTIAALREEVDTYVASQEAAARQRRRDASPRPLAAALAPYARPRSRSTSRSRSTTASAEDDPAEGRDRGDLSELPVELIEPQVRIVEDELVAAQGGLGHGSY